MSSYSFKIVILWVLGFLVIPIFLFAQTDDLDLQNSFNTVGQNDLIDSIHLVGAITPSGQIYLYNGPLLPQGGIFLNNSLPLNELGLVLLDDTVFLTGQIELTQSTQLSLTSIQTGNAISPNGTVVLDTLTQLDAEDPLVFSAPIDESDDLNEATTVSTASTLNPNQNLSPADQLALASLLGQGENTLDGINDLLSAGTLTSTTLTSAQAITLQNNIQLAILQIELQNATTFQQQVAIMDTIGLIPEGVVLTPSSILIPDGLQLDPGTQMLLIQLYLQSTPLQALQFMPALIPGITLEPKNVIGDGGLDLEDPMENLDNLNLNNNTSPVGQINVQDSTLDFNP